MSEVRIWRYLVFWALKKVKGPSRRVKTVCRTRHRDRKSRSVQPRYKHP